MQQIGIVLERNNANNTEADIQKFIQKEYHLYELELEQLLLRKSSILKESKHISSHIFILKKQILHHKLHDAKFAILRDEVLLKSYQIIREQHKMIRNIFLFMDYYSIEILTEYMNKEFVKNQLKMAEITAIDYHALLDKNSTHPIFKEAQKNIKNYYALIEINTDILNYLSFFKTRIFRLNKYQSHGLLELALYFDKTSWGIVINRLVVPYGLSSFKIILMMTLSLIIFIFRTIILNFINRLFLKIRWLQDYTKDILIAIEKPVKYVIILLNLQVIMYIYYDFNHLNFFEKFFYISYSFLFSYIFYLLLNTIASIQINSIEKSQKKIKNEMVNVSIKFINFLIILMGLLLMLHFAGANLSTVLSGLGIGGFAVALAVRESLSNFFGTISILMSDIYSQGDWVVINNQEGRVIEIGLRVTTLRTFDNALISIPNGTIAMQEVKNWDKRILGRRIKMSIGLKYSSSATQLQKVVKEIREMLSNHKSIASEKTRYDEALKKKSTKFVSKKDALGIKNILLVYLDEFSSSSINILVYCYSKKTQWKEWLETKEDVMYQIMSILQKHGVEFAFPSMSIYNEALTHTKTEDIQ